MDEQQLANQPVDPVAQAEEAPTTNQIGADPADSMTEEGKAAQESEPSPNAQDSTPVEANPVEEAPVTPEEASSKPVDQSEVFKTEYEALVAKTGYCLQVTPKLYKDETTGVYNSSQFTLEVTVAENK